MNIVAKHAHKFNRCATHSDRTKYNRKGFHVDWGEDEPPVMANYYRR